jgi:outer membrane protein assembly factor BamB
LLWEASLPAGQVPYTATLAGETLYVGTASGALYRAAQDEIACLFQAGDRINSIAVSDVHGDGRSELMLGSEDYSLYLLDEAGGEQWRRALPAYLHEPLVRVVTTAHLGLAKGRAVIAGGNNCHVHAFSPDGEELWRHEVIHGVRDVCPVDVTGDGLDEILAVTDWSTYQCIDPQGKGLWPVWSVRSRYAQGSNVVRAADISGDGVPEMVCGARDSCVYAFSRAGELLWEFFTGEEISGLAFADLDGDGVVEVVAGAMNGFVYGLDGSGQELWHLDVGEEVNSTIALSVGRETRIVVGTDGPVIHLIDLEGSVRARLNVGSPVRTVCARADDVAVYVYAICRDGRLAAYRVQA